MRRIYIILGLLITLPAFADNTSVTTVEYVTDVVGSKQNIISAGTGDRVVTYSASAGTLGSRAILDDLSGTTTTDTSLATATSMEDLVYSKNNELVNLSNQNVLTYSGTEGTVTATPIYNSTNNTFANGLVTAGTLNTAMIDAANNELICGQRADPNNANSECLLWQINTGMTGPLTTTANLPANINGTSECYKSHGGTINVQGNCSAGTYGALNAGQWGAVFPYGTVTGISMCSNIAPSIDYGRWDNDYMYAQIPTNQSGIQTAYDNWVGAGRPTAASSFAGGYCYCKVTDPEFSAARWVFLNSFAVSSCAYDCAPNCASNARFNADFRGSLFGAAAN